jgi:hypothetical protein
MAARQIPQYTEAQLAREIARVGARKISPLPEDDFNAVFDYLDELHAEDQRRAEIRGKNPSDGGPSWDMKLTPGRHLRTVRVA